MRGPVRQSAVDKAFAEVTKLQERAAGIEADAAARAAELADLEQRSGAEAYDDPSRIGVLAEQSSRLRAAIDVLGRTRAVAAQRIVDAQREALRARAAESRERAETLLADADKRQGTTDRLLAELATHEDVEFTPKPQYQDTGTVPLPWTPPTRTIRMRDEARFLVSEAEDLVSLAALTDDDDPRAAEKVTARFGWLLQRRTQAVLVPA